MITVTTSIELSGGRWRFRVGLEGMGHPDEIKLADAMKEHIQKTLTGVFATAGITAVAWKEEPEMRVGFKNN